MINSIVYFDLQTVQYDGQATAFVEYPLWEAVNSHLKACCQNAWGFELDESG